MLPTLPSSRTSTAPPTERRLELDALRGLMLVWITLTHLPTTLSTYINQPLGYVSATEGFIFLSALFTGLIYFRWSERNGWLAMWRKLWLRTGRLYLYHLSLLLLAFLIGAPIAARSYRPALHNLLDFYFTTGRTQAFVDAALLLYRPPLLDILPIYIIFLVLTPLVLVVTQRIAWRYALAGSFALWLFAQFGFRSFVHELLVRRFGLSIPLNEMGAFDLWAWQLWWTVGLYFGVRWGKGKPGLLLWARRLVFPAAFLALFFFVLRHAEAAGLVEIGRFGVLVNKWSFGAARILDAAALAILAIRFPCILKRLTIRPLVILGQASLEVFCAQLLCVFVALATLRGNAVLTGWQAGEAVLISLCVIYSTAMIITNRRATRTERKPLALVPQPIVRKAA